MVVDVGWLFGLGTMVELDWVAVGDALVSVAACAGAVFGVD